MGVTGLWPLLEPVGRRVNIETLAGKKVAIGEREGVFFTSRLECCGAALGVCLLPRPVVFYAPPGVAEEGTCNDKEQGISREVEQKKRACARNGVEAPALSQQRSCFFFIFDPLSLSLFSPQLPLFSPKIKTNADASIWVHQFVKAMRDSQGEPLPNAHLLGFFRRACR